MGSFLSRVVTSRDTRDTRDSEPSNSCLPVSVQVGGGGGGGAAHQEGLPHHRPQPRPGRPRAAEEARGHPGLVQPDQGEAEPGITVRLSSCDIIVIPVQGVGV